MTTPNPSSEYKTAEMSHLPRTVRTDPDITLMSDALAALPGADCDFLEFHLIRELGRGAFGKVYLARQGVLANRLVALKVSVDAAGESQKLAQLQHTNIVPIYSVHRTGLFQAVCMPYFGPTTLADILQALRGRPSVPTTGKELVAILREKAGTLATDNNRALPVRILERLTYVHAILWIGARLAEGLEHAHERGILHNDLKPANVLLTDEGLPMLLDFNLSADTKDEVDRARFGGTLPYMPPERLAAMGSRAASKMLDARSDLYSLGVMMHELLTGRYPFATPGGRLPEAAATMLAERRAGAPSVRAGNRAASLAVAAVVGRLLEAEPNRRYSSAHEVRVDLECQLADRPLQFTREPSLRERASKWLRRHPRLSSPVAVAAMILMVVAGVAALALWQQLTEQRAAVVALQAEQERERLALQEEGRVKAEAEVRKLRSTLASLREGENEVATVRSVADAGPIERDASGDDVARCRAALARYGVLDDPKWQEAPALSALEPAARAQVQRDVSELLFLLARSILLDVAGGKVPAPADLDLALRCNQQARQCYGDGPLPLALLMQQARLADLAGKEDEARALHEEAEKHQPRTARDAYLAAFEYAALAEFSQAHKLAEQSRQLDPTRSSTWFLLGLCHARLGDPARAVRAFDTCLDLQPDGLAATYYRGLAHLQLKQWQPAHADLTRVISQRPQLALAHVQRAAAARGLRQYRDAVTDVSAALQLTPGRAELHYQRARLKELSGDGSGATEDDRVVFRSEPHDCRGWIHRGVSATRLQRMTEAFSSFRNALAAVPQNRADLEEMAQALVSLKDHFDEGIALLDEALRFAPRSTVLRLGRAHLLALDGKRAQAQAEVEACFPLVSDAATQFEAACIFARTARSQAERTRALELLAVSLRQGYRRNNLAQLDCFAPLQQDPRFHNLVQAARLLDAGGL